uniref:Uncharacterized protein n=1 Tax=Sexangularia sp. CB-2014 TaxID=1486929 RepID=A0A7S1VQ07_9EUKA|mmetsp:Transcript_6520/g.21104  ORF Transcript_6520/g.21104 Transcript_6520/m.21104 type:complete len:794 (+) Transcript_6520:112-2493(+)|eukprot:CAMPEP_0170747714 /NCGR_PEP_ID=MMETSP0437-20130122/9466_1 /TAXON_ID=0 /ORGANISM="Sexangularia sp." /LENGTH=793 /DNA_ID=CAMNT_0011086503 /DNA_START=37 /DNA_END=2418 /DNA_ORIENTATION=+
MHHVKRKESKRHTLKVGAKGIAAAGLLNPATSGNFVAELGKVKVETASIVQLLSSQRPDDVQELVTTAQKALKTLDRLFARAGHSQATNVLQSKLLMDAVDKLNYIVTDYIDLLKDLTAKGTLAKTLTSSRGRRKFEQLNSALLVETTVLEELSEDMLASHDTEYQKLPQFDTTPEEKVEIDDPEGHALWVDLFGDTAFMVDVNKLVKGLMRALEVNLTTAERTILLLVFDPSNTGTISSLRWNEFLKGFGPMSACLHNLQSMLAKPWFHGFLSRDDATKLLEVEPVGTYMVRFSSTKPGSFSLAHTMAQGKVNHVIIHTRSNGFAIREDNAKEKLFPTVQHLVDAYEGILVQPYMQTFPRQLWWHGDISGDEASDLLKGRKPGTFLIRFSATQRGCFASSYVGQDGTIEKGLIVGSPTGYQMSGKTFTSMEEIVASLVHWGIFSEPYKNTTNEVNDKQRHKIVSEIVSTEVSYLRSLQTAIDLFLNEFRKNPKVKPEDTETIFGNIEQIVSLHTNMLQKLEAAMAHWDPDDTRLGGLFLELCPLLVPVYSPYVNNYTESIKLLDRLAENKQFAVWVRALLDKQREQNALSSFLITPVQRIPRYILLLADLAKHTPGAHSDYDDLSDAIEGLRRAAAAVNDSKRVQEDQLEVKQLMNKITDLGEDIAEMGRSLVREGRLIPLEEGKVKSSDYYVFLFSDMMLVTKRKGKLFKHKFKVPLVSAQVLSLPDAGGLKNQLRVASLEGEWTFVGDNPEDRDQWLAKMKNCVTKIQEQHSGNASVLAQSAKTAKMMGL